jgi:hypothetical protein
MFSQTPSVSLLQAYPTCLLTFMIILVLIIIITTTTTTTAAAM